MVGSFSFPCAFLKTGWPFFGFQGMSIQSSPRWTLLLSVLGQSKPAGTLLHCKRMPFSIDRPELQEAKRTNIASGHKTSVTFFFFSNFLCSIPKHCTTSYSSVFLSQPGLTEPWEVYSKDGAYFSYGADTSCLAPESLVFKGQGYCSNGLSAKGILRTWRL